MKAAVVDILTNERIPLTLSQHIEFGEGDDKITVTVTDGLVQIDAERMLIVIPRASNVVRVRSVR